MYKQTLYIVFMIIMLVLFNNKVSSMQDEQVNLFQHVIEESKEIEARTNDEVRNRYFCDHVRFDTPWGKRYFQFRSSKISSGEWEGAPTMPHQNYNKRLCSAFLGFKIWPSSKVNSETNASDLYSGSFDFVKFARVLGMPWWNEHPIKLALISMGITGVFADGIGYWFGSKRS